MKIFNATKLTATIVLSVAIMVSACAIAQQQGSETQQQEQARQDSINKALEQMRQDSINKAIEQIKLDSIREDSIRRNRVTPDLALFELHGPVKSVNKGYITGFADNGANFDKDGKVTSLNKISYINKRGNITRDANGRIKSISCREEEGWPTISSDNITYDGNNLPIKIYGKYLESTGNSSLKYNNGLLASETNNFDGEGDITKSTITYTYLKFDKYGNWTSRKASFKNYDYEGYCNSHSETQTRTITYYE